MKTRTRLLSVLLCLALLVSLSAAFGAPALAAASIDSVSVSDLAMPAFGEAFGKTASVGGGSYSVEEIRWSNENNGGKAVAGGETAVTGVKYRYDVWLKPASGYFFPHADGTGNYPLYTGTGTLNGAAFTGDPATGAKAVVATGSGMGSYDGYLEIWGYYYVPDICKITIVFDQGVESVEINKVSYTTNGDRVGWFGNTVKTGGVTLKAGFAVDAVTLDNQALTVNADNSFTFRLEKDCVLSVTTKQTGTVSRADVTGVTAPAAGALPGTAYALSASGCKITGTSWYDQTAGAALPAGKPFEAGHSYTFLAELEAEKGWTFPADSGKLAATVNGLPAVVRSGSGGQCTLSYTWPQLAAVPFPFTDVPASAWYYADVKSAWEKGLVNGKGASTFCPNDNMTCAEAIKLAACMHQKYHTGSVTLKSGSSIWYSTYLDYAKANGIPWSFANYSAPITRADYVHIFYAALPKEEYTAKHAASAIPDVDTSTPAGREILEFYMAGILTGYSGGYFKPANTIARSEVAAILSRMMDADARK